jgi:hypothetical protein
VKYPSIGTIFQQLSPLYISMTVVVILATALIATVGTPVLKWKTKE